MSSCDTAAHLDTLVVGADVGALQDLRQAVLAPMASLSPKAAERLTETLQSWLLHLGRRSEVAEDLHIHPQTVRYRMNQVRGLYGDPSTIRTSSGNWPWRSCWIHPARDGHGDRRTVRLHLASPRRRTRSQIVPRPMTVSDSIDIAVDRETAYDAVSDVTQMGRWSPENLRRDAPAGWRAVGRRRHVRRHQQARLGAGAWQTRCLVASAERPERFAFTVTHYGYQPILVKVPVASWEYRFEAIDGGTRVTETWRSDRTRWPDAVAAVFDRAATGGQLLRLPARQHRTHVEAAQGRARGRRRRVRLRVRRDVPGLHTGSQLVGTYQARGYADPADTSSEVVTLSSSWRLRSRARPDGLGGPTTAPSSRTTNTSRAAATSTRPTDASRSHRSTPTGPTCTSSPTTSR